MVKLRKYDYGTAEEITSLQQYRVIEQAIFTYSSPGKAFEKRIKTIAKQGEKQIRALVDLTNSRVNEFKSIRDLFPSYMITTKLKIE